MKSSCNRRRFLLFAGSYSWPCGISVGLSCSWIMWGAEKHARQFHTFTVIKEIMLVEGQVLPYRKFSCVGVYVYFHGCCGGTYCGFESVSRRKRTEVTIWFRLPLNFELWNYCTVLFCFLKFFNQLAALAGWGILPVCFLSL
jgi:hypothetical protein